GQRRPAEPLYPDLPFVPISHGRTHRRLLAGTPRRPLAPDRDGLELCQSAAWLVCLGQHVLGRADGCLHPAADGRRHPRAAGDRMTETYETLTADGLVIGAAAAGWRPAVDAP